MLRRPVVCVTAFVLSLAFAATAPAQGGHSHGQPAALTLRPSECPDPVAGQPLEQPKVIPADRYGVIDTRFVVDSVQYACVPVWNSTTGTWTTRPMNLRTYGTPISPYDPTQLEWTLPGPTLRARKTYLQDDRKPPGPDNRVVTIGSRVSLTLRNQLPNTTYPYDQCLPSYVVQTTASNTCPEPPCTFAEEAPECFHGSEVTNLHYHGTHVSPQPHQDFVLLNLYSAEQTNPPPPKPDEYNQIGDYHYSIDPFPWNQAPGTHWYHPHKHGSTALQVANGMSGALIIQGPFDDWLYSLYGVNDQDLDSIEAFEKILIIQQLQEDLNYYTPGSATAQPTVNGQATPVVTMRPGEVQRWRFIGGMVHAGGALNVEFPQQVTVKQIAQDGVQFASENYLRQPFVKKAVRAIAAAADGKVTATLTDVPFGTYVISPGNRADFLVQAPLEKGTYELEFELVHGNLAAEVLAPFKQRNAVGGGKATAAAAAKPKLFIVKVEGEAVDQSLPIPINNPRCNATPRPKECWPETPYYLRDLEAPKTPARKVAFSMTEPDGTVTKNAQQRNSFWINDMQYMDDCAGVTMTRGTTEDWNVTNDSPLGHPFHIHINPFQVLDYPINFPNIAAAGPPYPWMDTIPLPVGTCQPNGACQEVGVTIRQEFADFTGGYVIHCHFLGHEDRGMMLNVQTVCPQAKDPWLWGLPQTAGPDNCNLTRDALGPCKPYTPQH